MSARSEYSIYCASGMKALGGVYSYVAGSGLDKSLLDLVYLRSSQINGCSYCIDSHATDLLKAGASPCKLLLLSCWQEARDWFTLREQAALAWAEAVTLVSETHVPDDVYAAAHAQFNDKQLADLTIAISLINAYNRIAISFRRGPQEPPPGSVSS